MVLLGEIIQSQQYFSRLTTGVPSLDQIFINNNNSSQSTLLNKIYDFQSAPSCQAMYLVTTSLIISHLQNNNSVIIIDTLNRFPLSFITKHRDFQTNWLNDSLKVYDRDTFAKLYSFFIYNKEIPKNCMIIINDFHELVELYKLEMSSSYEELLLKHHIDMNLVYIHNKNNNEKLPMPELPSTSDLLRTSPIAKFESHVDILFSKLIQLCITQSSMIFLLGHLDTKYQPYKTRPTSQQQPSSQPQPQPQSQVPPGRVVLTPYKFTKISTRIIFYNDWYHKTRHFQDTYTTGTTNNPIMIKEDKLRMVLAAKLELPKQKLMYNPIYFDVNEPFYCNTTNSGTTYSIIDLSASYLSDNDTDVDIPSSPIEYESTSVLLDVSINQDATI
ncbi:hypothetical protein JA1_003912 [Spathaspora sp. JA1]|nr:hypothetical protein JA1_003912 [Spathaspora sp. JA1]